MNNAFMDQRHLQNLKVVYGFALALIALTILSSSFVMQYAIKRNGGDSRIINLSGRQRMLSQRLTKCVLALERLSSGPERTRREQEIVKSFTDWKAAHLGLQYGDEKLGLPKRKNTLEIRGLFAEMEPYHRAMVEALERLHAEMSAPNPVVIHATADVLLANEPSFLKLMDKITFQFDKEAKERISSMQLLEKIILTVGLSILLFEFCFVFRPSLSQLSTMMTALKSKTIELEDANHRLQESLDQLHHSSRLLTESNRKVMDSINYARLIQAAMLPDPSLLDRHLKEWFIMYRQRDIVGGDFYYLRAMGDNCVFAVIDCTGHGVPGALMTMTVHTLLKNIPDSLCTADTALILGELDRLVREALPHDTSGQTIEIGLDIGICFYSPAERRIVFSGAGLSLFVAEPSGVTELPGDRRRMGRRRSHSASSHTNHEMILEPGVHIYLCTDGFFDQDGGGRGFGFGRDRFREMLESAVSMPMAEQKLYFQKILDRYRGTAPQRDDILMMGVQI